MKHGYFSYGSNMSLDQMMDRCPSAEIIIHSMEFKDMELCFPHKAKRRNCGVASIKQSTNSSVFGTLFSISSDDMIRLDIFEGLGNGYSRKYVEETQDHPDFWYYYSLKNHRNEFHEPSKEYLNLIIEGAISQNLPSFYIDDLKKIKVI